MYKCIFACVLLVTAWTAQARTPEIVLKHQQMLYAVVQVEAGRGMGSGTVIYSQKNEAGEWETFILTNRHVVAGAIKVGTEWNPQKQEDVKTERRSPVKARWHQYNNLSAFIGTSGKTGDIVAYDANADLALIQIRDRENGVSHVANLLPEDEHLYQGETVYAVGGGLGKPPFMTDGVLGHMEEVVDGYPYLLATAPIIFGNSGGALFHRNIDSRRYEMIGVPAMVSVAWGAGAITHMGWAIKMGTVRAFLRSNCFGFVLDDEVEREECQEVEE